MKGVIYWEQRAEALEQSIYKGTLQYEKRLMGVFSENAKEIEKDISHFLTKYADENGLTYAQASKNLTRIELSDYRKQVKSILAKYEKTGSPELLKRIEELNARAVVTRLDAIKGQLDARVYAMTEVINNDTREHLAEVYEKAYKGAGDNIAFGLDIDDAFHMVNFSVPEAVLAYPYSGLMFSERIWKCTDKLALSIQETLQKGLVQGKSIKNMVKDLNERLTQKGVSGYSNYDLSRVVRTESSFVLNQAAHDVNKKYGITQYSIYCSNDERTCRHCASRHGDVYDEAEMALGLNAPPFHPHCRCTTLAIIPNSGVVIDEFL